MFRSLERRNRNDFSKLDAFGVTATTRVCDSDNEGL